MAPEGSPVIRALAEVTLVRDEIHVALDFLTNLLGPTGPDVQARAASRRWWQRGGAAHERLDRGLLTSRTGGSGVPQGDQLRRTRLAVTDAVLSLDRWTTTNHPDEPEPITARRAHAAGLIAVLDLPTLAAALDPARRPVTPAEVTAMITALRRAESAVVEPERHLRLLAARADRPAE